jgi:hypothetical protein
MKLNAAVVHNASDRSILPVYYIPGTSMQYYQFPEWVNGCVQVDGLHPRIEEQIRKYGLSDALIQKSYVKALTVTGLLDTYGLQAANTMQAVPSVRLFKVDAEGYDISLINDMIDYYSNRIGLRKWQQEQSGAETVPRITERWPCVIFFETQVVDQDHSAELEQLSTRLEVAGYTNYASVRLHLGRQHFKTWEINNAAYLNCQCSLHDFNVVSTLLIFNGGKHQFETSVVQDRCKRMGYNLN